MALVEPTILWGEEPPVFFVGAWIVFTAAGSGYFYDFLGRERQCAPSQLTGGRLYPADVFGIKGYWLVTHAKTVRIMSVLVHQ